MALPNLSLLSSPGLPPLPADTLAGVAGASQNNQRYTAQFPIVNVKAYGAKGDGSTDDTAAIQAAFDAAFGPASAPHGQGSGSAANVPVYFPAGNYKTTAPLYLTSVSGGWIFGAGSGCTTIGNAGPYNGNSLVASPGDTITPVLMLNGVQYSRIEGLGISASDSNTVGIYIWTTNSGAKGGPNSSTGITFSDLLIQSMTVGILAGYLNTDGTCSECAYIGVTFVNCSLAGLRTVDQNALNHSVYGGGAAGCASGSTYNPGVTVGNGGAAYSCVTGGIDLICDPSLSGNTWDFYCGSSGPTAIVGGRTESINCIAANASQFYVSGFLYGPSDSTGGIFVDCSFVGRVVMSSCNYGPAGGTGVIVKLGNDGQAILDDFVSGPGATSSGITGTSGSKLYLRGCSFSNGSPLSGFSGTIGQNI